MSDISYTKVTPAIYEGKASNVYAVEEDSEVVILERKDDITAGNGKKHDVIPGKGALCNQISNILFRHIDDAYYISTVTHFREALSDTETVVNKAAPIKLEVVVRNIATGSIIKRLPFDDATGSIIKRLPFDDKQELDVPVVELYYKDDASGDPFLNETEAEALGILDEGDYDDIKESALDANDTLRDLFAECGITLVDMKLEFGWSNNELVVIDEISPDTCRLWDAKTGKKLDKDIYREGGSLEDVLAAYQEVLRRLKEAIGEEDDADDDGGDGEASGE